MRTALLIFVGAGLGGLLRHFVNQAITRARGFDFPWGTMVINVTGSIMMGLATGFFAFHGNLGWSHEARLFLLTGVLGGYTTFSTFSLDAMTLIERGDFRGAGLYLGGSVGLAVVGLLSALFLAQATL